MADRVAPGGWANGYISRTECHWIEAVNSKPSNVSSGISPNIVHNKVENVVLQTVYCEPYKIRDIFNWY